MSFTKDNTWVFTWPYDHCNDCGYVQRTTALHMTRHGYVRPESAKVFAFSAQRVDGAWIIHHPDKDIPANKDVIRVVTVSFYDRYPSIPPIPTLIEDWGAIPTVEFYAKLHTYTLGIVDTGNDDPDLEVIRIPHRDRKRVITGWVPKK